MTQRPLEGRPYWAQDEVARFTGADEAADSTVEDMSAADSTTSDESVAADAAPESPADSARATPPLMTTAATIATTSELRDGRAELEGDIRGLRSGG